MPAPAAPSVAPSAPSTPSTPSTPSMTTPGTTTPTTPSPDTSASSALASGAGEAGAGAAGTGAPTMFGDLLAPAVCGPVIAQIPGQGNVVIPAGTTRTFPAGTVFNYNVTQGNNVTTPAGTGLTAAQARLPISVGQTPSCGIGTAALVARGAFKISENESPRPMDRVFLNYNYFNNVTPFATSPNGLQQTDIHRAVVGFERTFLDGDASFGMRLPFLDVTGDPNAGLAHKDFGDLTIVTKYAFYNCRETGDVLSGGLVLTVPTGANFLPPTFPDIHSWLFQPYVGGIFNSGDFFVFGFSSIVIPSDSRDVTFLSNDLAVGYRAYSCNDGMITSITPTIEGHLTTPLNHRGSMNDPVGLPDIFDLTFATRIGIGDSATLGVGLVIPLTGPKPFDWEGQIQFNFYF
jgi:hypothetical protein